MIRLTARAIRALAVTVCSASTIATARRRWRRPSSRIAGALPRRRKSARRRGQDESQPIRVRPREMTASLRKATHSDGYPPAGFPRRAYAPRCRCLPSADDRANFGALMVSRGTASPRRRVLARASTDPANRRADDPREQTSCVNPLGSSSGWRLAVKRCALGPAGRPSGDSGAGHPLGGGEVGPGARRSRDRHHDMAVAGRCGGRGHTVCGFARRPVSTPRVR